MAEAVGFLSSQLGMQDSYACSFFSHTGPRRFRPVRDDAMFSSWVYEFRRFFIILPRAVASSPSRRDSETRSGRPLASEHEINDETPIFKNTKESHACRSPEAPRTASGP